jgi:hypothetical protein
MEKYGSFNKLINKLSSKYLYSILIFYNKFPFQLLLKNFTMRNNKVTFFLSQNKPDDK